MKRWILSYAPIFVVLALIPGCSGSLTSVEDRLVEGDWAWVRATGGVAGTEITPESEGYTMHLRFGAGGTVELFRDGELQVGTTFQLLPPSDDYGAPPYDRIGYGAPLLGGWEEQFLVEIDDERLILADPCCDGFVYEFRAS